MTWLWHVAPAVFHVEYVGAGVLGLMAVFPDLVKRSGRMFVELWPVLLAMGLVWLCAARLGSRESTLPVSVEDWVLTGFRAALVPSIVGVGGFFVLMMVMERVPDRLGRVVQLACVAAALWVLFA